MNEPSLHTYTRTEPYSCLILELNYNLALYRSLTLLQPYQEMNPTLILYRRCTLPPIQMLITTLVLYVQVLNITLVQADHYSSLLLELSTT